MPIRFSTEAANADVMGEEPQSPTAAEPAPLTADADRTVRPQGERKSDSETDAAKPGKDINAAGFVKDKDSSTP